MKRDRAKFLFTCVFRLRKFSEKEFFRFLAHDSPACGRSMKRVFLSSFYMCLSLREVSEKEILDSRSRRRGLGDRLLEGDQFASRHETTRHEEEHDGVSDDADQVLK